MGFYDNVKDRVRDENTPDEQEQDQGDNVAFDELIENAKQREEDEQEQEPDDTEIEDLSSASGKDGDYGDPSKIELNDQAEPQAGASQARQQQSEVKKEQRKDVKKPSSGTEPQGTSQQAPSPKARDGKKKSLEPASSENSQERQEDDLLRQIRDQNREIVKLLQSIDRKLGQ